MARDPDKDQISPENPVRRDVLRLCFAALPLLAASLAFPSRLLAAPQAKMGDTLVPQHEAAVPSPLAKPRPPRLLMIDPGHGGHDPGAIGLSGTPEKDITLDISMRMASALRDEANVAVKLTRTDDIFIPLADRVKMGVKARADLFLSIHADSAPNQSARGLSAYTLSAKASDQFSSMLADKENHADVIGGLDLPTEDQEVAAILFDLAARHTRNTAQRVKVGFIKAMGRRWRLLEEPMRSANFAVLRSPEVPSMLIETGFLSNRQDEALLCKPAERQKIAELMAKEIAFLLKSPLFG